MTPTVVDSTTERALVVRGKLLQIKGKIEDNFLDLCDLLTEAQQQNYNTVWGYPRFGDWVKEASGLDISPRQAYYYITITKKAAELGLTRDMIKRAKISNLKKIFTLEPKEHAAEMRQLVSAASNGASMDSIEAAVRSLKIEGGSEAFVNVNYRIPEAVKDVLDEAFELARKHYGDTMVGDEVGEITDAKCLELIAVTFTQDPNFSTYNN